MLVDDLYDLDPDLTEARTLQTGRRHVNTSAQMTARYCRGNRIQKRTTTESVLIGNTLRQISLSVNPWGLQGRKELVTRYSACDVGNHRSKHPVVAVRGAMPVAIIAQVSPSIVHIPALLRDNYGDFLERPTPSSPGFWYRGVGRVRAAMAGGK